MKKVFSLIEQLLDNDSTVLILGESGTGKEMVAKAIHCFGDRKSKPLVTVNCGAIPEDLLESELFGHEKGAFTGATQTRLGKFEMANTGTIFLDEIGDMSPSLQVKLLRVVQESEFDRVGGMKSIKVNVRIIAATNKDLEDSVQKGTFREDLYYRINVIPVSLPPLRLRKEDIPTLSQHFIKKFNKTKNRSITGITKEAMDLLVKHSWKGNIRELENIIERAVILKRKGNIVPADLPEKISGISEDDFDGFDEENVVFEEPMPLVIGGEGASTFPRITLPEGGVNLKELVDSFENDLLYQALNRTGWVKGKAADLLGLNRTTLVEKIKKKGIKEN